jgi:hypothetical protein
MQTSSSPAESLPKVIIIGGGFGGLTAAKELAGKGVSVTLIDRTNHHLFQPLLYQVATAGLSPADIAQPIRHILRDAKNVEVVLGEVGLIDSDAKQIWTTDNLGYAYDFLILAAGARHSYFGHEAWEAFAPGLKSLEDAIELRRRILRAFEAAEMSHSEKWPAQLPSSHIRHYPKIFGGSIRAQPACCCLMEHRGSYRLFQRICRARHSGNCRGWALMSTPEQSSKMLVNGE